jgi:hypothetical protein
VPIPKHYHCEISSDGGDFVLLPTWASAVQAIRSAAARKRRRHCGRALAGSHGPTWCDPAGRFPSCDVHAERRRRQGLGDIADGNASRWNDWGAMSAEDRDTVTEAMSMVTPCCWPIANGSR